MADPEMSTVPGARRLSDLHKGARGVVVGIVDAHADRFDDGPAIGRRLLEIGFAPGERFEVVQEVWPGDDPMAVRIGASLFALRRREAECILVDAAG